MGTYVFITSYADAERKRIKPVDSIIGAVIIKKSKPPYKIVGYAEGHTFKKGEVTFSKNLKKYTIVFSHQDENTFVMAINSQIAKAIAKYHWNRFSIYETTTKQRKV